MTNLQKEQIVQLRTIGESYARIADALSISINTVQSYCRRNNLGGNVTVSAEKTAATKSFCKNCGKELDRLPGQKARRFCSDKCRLEWWNSHPEAVSRKAVYHFVCPTCGAEFTAYGNARRKYCSHSCYIKARFATEAGDAL
jgi:endogenous inhibitor of DNA gyrase (YacG/DUF329 family)